MSTQKGNSKRSRPQKYQNHTAFKNDLHDKSHTTKAINNIEVANVCERCKKIIEWKIKYKKYKPLKTPSKCAKCEQKSVKHAYHNTCLPCAQQLGVCPKCGNKGEIVEGKPSKEESIKLDAEMQALLKKLSERKRRTFLRYMNRIGSSKNNAKHKKNFEKNEKDGESEEGEEEEEEENKTVMENISKEDLLLKLKSLAIKRETDDDFDADSDFDSDFFT